MGVKTLYKRIGLPVVIRDFYPGYFWSQRKLHQYTDNLKKLKFEEVEWILDYPILCSNPPRAIYDLNPNDLLLLHDENQDHRSRIHNADLSFPIHVLFKDERFVILDGVHRVLKLKLANATFIHAYVLNEDDLYQIRATKEDFNSGFLLLFSKGLD